MTPPTYLTRYTTLRNLSPKVHIWGRGFSIDIKYEGNSLDILFFNFARYLHVCFWDAMIVASSNMLAQTRWSSVKLQSDWSCNIISRDVQFASHGHLCILPFSLALPSQEVPLQFVAVVSHTLLRFAQYQNQHAVSHSMIVFGSIVLATGEFVILWRRIPQMVVTRWRKSSGTMKWKLLLLANTIGVVGMGRCSYVVWLHNRYPHSNIVAHLICLCSISLDLLFASSGMGVERFPSEHGGTVWSGQNMMVSSLFANRHCSIRQIPWGKNRPLQALHCRSD
jgi:hypothetical protein